jgi:CheY-like chemotaxis protein
MLRLNRRSQQETTVRPLRVLVAAPQPLHRELVRFFLEEAGCQVVALVASGEDAVSLGTSKRPDAVILHESLADMAGAGLIQRVRQGSTSTKIVVVTPQPELAWSGPSRGADAFLEEWIGIQELGIVLQRLCPRTPVPAQSAPMQPEQVAASTSTAAGQRRLSPSPRVVNLPMGPRARWHERLWGAAVASVILILLLLGRGLFQEPATSEGPGSAASAHLTSAYLTLDVLVVGMRGGMSEEDMAETARRLIAERSAALASGADTTRLDAAIDTEVSPLLSDVTDKGAAAIEYVLGDLLSIQGPPAQPRAWPGLGAESRAHPNGQVPPQAVDHPGRIVDRPSVPKPGAQSHADAEPGAQSHADAEPGAQPDGDAEPGAQPDGDAEPGAQPDGDAERGARTTGNAEPSETPSSDSPSPTGTTSPSERRGPTGAASPDVSPSESRAQSNRPLQSPRAGTPSEFESEAALTPIDRVDT